MLQGIYKVPDYKKSRLQHMRHIKVILTKVLSIEHHNCQIGKNLRDSKRSGGTKLPVRVCDANSHQQEKERNFKPEAEAKKRRPKDTTTSYSYNKPDKQ